MSLSVTSSNENVPLTYYQRNREKILAQCKAYRANNKKKVAEYSSRHYQANKEKRKRQNKLWRKNHPELRRMYEKRHLSDPKNAKNKLDKCLKRRRDRYKNDIAYRIKRNLRNSFYRAVIKGVKKSSVLNILGCSIDEFKRHIESKFVTGMSWENWGLGKGKWNLDHILPIASFDMFSKEDQQKCWHHSNFQPLWYKDNLLKSDKLPSGIRTRDEKGEL